MTTLDDKHKMFTIVLAGERLICELLNNKQDKTHYTLKNIGEALISFCPLRHIPISLPLETAMD